MKYIPMSIDQKWGDGQRQVHGHSYCPLAINFNFIFAALTELDYVLRFFLYFIRRIGKFIHSGKIFCYPFNA